MSKLRTMCRASVDTLCELFGKTRQAYYQKMNYEYSECVSESIVLDKISDIRRDMPKAGGRKLWYTINESLPEGLRIGRDALFDLMDRNGHGLKVRARRRTRTTFSSGWMRKWPNLIRDIVPTAANQIWVSDITYVCTRTEGFVYLHLVTDLYSKRIMKWCVSPTLQAGYTLSALRMAMRNAGCSLKGLIHHSDRGCQYCCDTYVKELRDNGIFISMTESGDPLKNATAERVNGILKMEWLNQEHFQEIVSARKRISEIISIYNAKRKHMSLGYRTPDHAYGMQGKQERCWKNYYRKHSDRDDYLAEILTSSNRTSGMVPTTM